MSSLRRIKFCFPIILFFLLAFSPSRDIGPLRLIQVAKNQPALEVTLWKQQIECLVEGEGSYVLKVSQQEQFLLKRQGIKLRILTLYDPRKTYFVVRITRPGEQEQLRNQLQLIKLEADDYLVVASDPLSLEDLPVSIPKKKLPVTGWVPQPLPAKPQVYHWRGLQENFYLQLAEQVSADNLRDQVVTLQNFGTRYALTSNCYQAGQFLSDYLASCGLSVRFQNFTYNGYQCRNVISEIPGQSYPEQVVIICAHYDSISNQRWTLAPGADDNASGTAAVLEVARILTREPLDFTVRFILFSAEELGLVGSQRYVTSELNLQENIIGVINLDMIAYADVLPEDLDVIGNPASSWLVDLVASMTALYGPAPAKKIISPSFVYSDHASFWDKGVPAICGIEDYNVPNPYYHQTTDTVDTLNFVFFKASTRAGLVSLARLAQPILPGYPLTPRSFDLSLKVYASIFNYLRKVVLSWQEVPGAMGYNIYRSNQPYSNFQKLNSRPLAEARYVDLLLPSDQPFYYAVTAVDSLNQESNMSRVRVVSPAMSYFSPVNYFWQNQVNR
jgi:hypothetical protein